MITASNLCMSVQSGQTCACDFSLQANIHGTGEIGNEPTQVCSRVLLTLQDFECHTPGYCKQKFMCYNY